MSAEQNPYQFSDGNYGGSLVAAEASVSDRADFIAKTYNHLAGAVIAYVVLLTGLLQVVNIEMIARFLGGNQFTWLLVVGGFILVSYVANSWAMSATSIATQYAGLSLYVVAQALITLPLVCLAYTFVPEALVMAAVATVVLFVVLTAVVFTTRKDFSFLGPALTVCGFAALGLIAAAVIFPNMVNLGVIFSVAMVVFACGYILYDTSNVLHHYHIGQHVAASLALFASVVLLFFYLLRIAMYLMASRD